MYYALDYRSSKPPIYISGIEHPRGKVLCFSDIKKRNQYLKTNKYIGMINKAYAELLQNYGVECKQIGDINHE